MKEKHIVFVHFDLGLIVLHQLSNEKSNRTKDSVIVKVANGIAPTCNLISRSLLSQGENANELFMFQKV